MDLEEDCQGVGQAGQALGWGAVGAGSRESHQVRKQRDRVGEEQWGFVARGRLGSPQTPGFRAKASADERVPS